MSSDATGWAFGHSPYHGATFTVHLAIADSVNDQNGNEFWMSVASLATKARCDRKTASHGVYQLLADGFLTLLEERIGRTTRYRFEFPSVEVVYNTRTVQPEVSDPGVSEPGSVEPGVSGPDEPANPGNLIPRPGVSRPTNPREPKQELQPKRRARCAELIEHTVAPAAPSAEEAEQFKLFWETYPKRKNQKKGKAQAERAWSRLSKPNRLAALKAVENYRDECEGGDYAKDAHRWISGKHWVDSMERAVSEEEELHLEALRLTAERNAEWLAHEAELETERRQKASAG